MDKTNRLHETGIPLAAVTGGMLLGGTSTFLVNLARALTRRGVLLPIINLSGQDEHARDFAKLHVEITATPAARYIYEDRLEMARRALAQTRPRAVLACLGADSFEVLRQLPAGVARIGIIQSDEAGPYEVSRRYAPWLDAMVGVSQHIVHHLSTIPELDRCRKVCIPYGIDFQPSPSAPADSRQAASRNQPLRLIYVGRIIEEQKRVSRLRALIEELARRRVEFEFSLVGDGPDLAPMRAALSHEPNVKFCGGVPNSEIPALLAQHDVFVLLSDYEGLPLSLLEAVGSGLVPVVSDLQSGIRDVVTPAVGFRIPIGDIAAAADAITNLAVDRIRLHTMSVAARTAVREEYSADRMAQRYLDLTAEAVPTPPDWTRLPPALAPLGLQPRWLYRGLGTMARRWVKRMASAQPSRSSRS